MNAQPHAHNVEITRQYPWRLEDRDKGGYQVVYGDTAVHVHRGPLLERRLRRAVPKAIRRHDRGSVRAAQKADRQAELFRRITADAEVSSRPRPLGSGAA